MFSGAIVIGSPSQRDEFRGLAEDLSSLLNVENEKRVAFFGNGLNAENEFEKTFEFYATYYDRLGFSVVEIQNLKRVATIFFLNPEGRVTYFVENVNLSDLHAAIIIAPKIPFQLAEGRRCLSDARTCAQQRAGQIVKRMIKLGVMHAI